MRFRWTIAVASCVLACVGAACGSGTESNSEGSTAVDPTSSSTSATPSATATTVVQSTTSSEPATTTTQAPDWRTELIVADVREGEFTEMEAAVAEWMWIDSVFEATIETLGNQNEGGRWCCENPPFTVSDINVLVGRAPDSLQLNGMEHQRLTDFLQPGDRVTVFAKGGTAAYVFARTGWPHEDGGGPRFPAHPVAPNQAEAIRTVGEIHAATSDVELEPFDLIWQYWSRYSSGWWGDVDQRVALVLSGVDGRPSTCSTADLAPQLSLVENPLAHEGITAEADETRQAIIDAALACDFEALIDRIPEYGGWCTQLDAAELRRQDQARGNLRQLAVALTALSADSTERPRNDGSTDTVYWWPGAHQGGAPLEDGTSFADRVTDDELAIIMFVNGNIFPPDATSEQFVEAVDTWGRYDFFRVGIADTGQWVEVESGGCGP